MKKTTRAAVGLVLVLGLTATAFVAGMFVGGQCCVAAGSGLAGGAMVVGYGVLAAGITGLIAIALAIYLPERTLIALTIAFALVGGVLGGMLFKDYLDSRAESTAYLQNAYNSMQPFRVTLTYTGNTSGKPFQQLAVDWARREYTVKSNEQLCSIELSGEEAVKILTALRAVDGIVYRDPFPCAGTPGVGAQEIDMFIPEAKPPNTVAKLAITPACLARHPALAEPFTVAAEIYRRNQAPSSCEPPGK